LASAQATRSRFDKCGGGRDWDGLEANDVSKPRKFRDSIDFESFLLENSVPADDLQSKTASKLLISQGFDAVEFGGNRILVIIFDQTQIAIFQSEQV
jgi:hypothetical protein